MLEIEHRWALSFTSKMYFFTSSLPYDYCISENALHEVRNIIQFELKSSVNMTKKRLFSNFTTELQPKHMRATSNTVSMQNWSMMFMIIHVYKAF